MEVNAGVGFVRQGKTAFDVVANRCVVAEAATDRLVTNEKGGRR